jgi:hypothetical protein
MLATLYRSILPPKLRAYIYTYFLGELLIFIRNFRMNAKCKFTFLFQKLLPKTDYNKALAFMGRHGLSSYPAPYVLDYKNRTVQLEFDSDKQMHYCMHNGKKLYFTSKFGKAQIVKLYKSLITEQDVRSAHRYVENYEDLTGMTLLDVGSAEGIFTLDNIERLEHAYLFEVEPFWIDALHATFEPWKEKVTIIKKYVGDQVSEDFITIDEFLKDKPKHHLFIKMDIEGAELKALEGAKNTLEQGQHITTAICTYHKPNDPETFEKLLQKHGFDTRFSEGYLFWGKRLSKAVIRGVKK